MSDGTKYRPTTTVVVAYDGSVASAVVPVNIFCVRLIATSDCFVKIGNNPTAAVTDMFLKAGIPEYFTVANPDKIAAIKLADAGNLNITYMT